jgi:hypothetical protein
MVVLVHFSNVFVSPRCPFLRFAWVGPGVTYL